MVIAKRIKVSLVLCVFLYSVGGIGDGGARLRRWLLPCLFMNWGTFSVRASWLLRRKIQLLPWGGYI